MPDRSTHRWLDVCVIRDVATFSGPGFTRPGLPVRIVLPWQWYVTAGEEGEPVLDPEGLLHLVLCWAALIVAEPVIVVRAEDDAMHGRPPGRPANPFRKPARFTAYWPR
jgi:hypothetical protein